MSTYVLRSEILSGMTPRLCRVRALALARSRWEPSDSDLVRLDSGNVLRHGIVSCTGSGI